VLDAIRQELYRRRLRPTLVWGVRGLPILWKRRKWKPGEREPGLGIRALSRRTRGGPERELHRISQASWIAILYCTGREVRIERCDCFAFGSARWSGHRAAVDLRDSGTGVGAGMS